MRSRHHHAGPLAAGLALVTGLLLPRLDAQQVTPADGCRLTGRATSATRPLPGVSLLVLAGDAMKAATSTEIDGSFSMLVAPGATYRLKVELTGFGVSEREVVVGPKPCDQKIDIELSLASRSGPGAPTTPAAPAASGASGTTGTGRAAGPRFETLAVQASATAAAALEVTPPDRESIEAATRSLLPPGFSSEGPTEAVAINGNMAQIDRGMMNDRMQAIGQGQVDPVTGEFRPGGPGTEVAFGGDQLGAGGRGGRGGPGGPGFPGGPGGRGGPGGPGGRGGPGLGGRGVQQRPYSFTSNYTFGGSALDSAPYQLRPDTPTSQRPYTRQNFGGTVGGPVKIPGVYDGTRRTNFQFNYSGNRSGNLFDQYATVPTEAIRNGDFSGAAFNVIDPETRLPFEGNRIPAGRISQGAKVLLDYIPQPNLDGTTRNFHYTTTTASTSNNVSVRITHNFTPAAGRGAGGARGAGGGGRGGAGGPAGGPGRGGRGNQATTVNMNVQLQYRTNESQQVNVFPTLGGETKGSSFSVPVGLTVSKARNMHTFNVNFSRSTSTSTNRYAYLLDVAGLAGINGVATDPFDWGVPSLSFSTFSGLRDTTPTKRSDQRLSANYSWSKPIRTHTLRAGTEFSQDWSDTQTDANARGSFVFTGLYSAGGGKIPRGGGLDFADFLLGLPQQASIQYGPGTVRMRGRSFGAFFQDDWRKGAGLTFNLGVRYDFVRPYQEAGGQMVNLDAAEGFTAVAPVVSGAVGPFSGAFPDGLVNADANNISPRVGFAWRMARATILRGGYAINYNTGSYSTIARQLVSQPPFAVTSTSIGSLADPLTLADPFVQATPTTTTNNYGIDRDYKLGVIQTWNADLSRDFGYWNLGAGYVGTKGSSLDLLRAPNRGPNGLLLPDVQAFTWQSSEGRSILTAGNFRLRRRPVAGVSFGATYTLAKSMDNTTATGGGATVAQDDRNIEAEWAVSSFDRRHQFSADIQIQLPFGPNRRFLNGGGLWAALLDGWSVNTTFTWNSGTPLTPRVSGAAADVARGTNGTLRASYNGQPIALDNPTIDQFFNTAAFVAPLPGEFGDALRNMIIGPGNRQLNANFSRDVRLGGNRSVSVQLSASNLLNMVQWSGVDTNVNSLTFGQVTSVRPMRSMQLNLRFRF